MTGEDGETLRAWADLRAALGEPGSGRLRYAAAMLLNRRGFLNDAALEVYRICSPQDWEDPAPVLAARGLKVPPDGPVPADMAVRRLVDEADRYLATLRGPGIAEVRGLIARWRDGTVAALPGAANPVVDAHLGPALDTLAPDRPALAGAIRAAAPHLPWITYDVYPPDDIGAAFLTGHAFASLIGEAAPIPAEDFDLGLFLVAPQLLYRDHAHPAPELYAPLTGPHGWRFGPGTPVAVKPAHEPVWNPPDLPHMTRVGPVPFLCLYGWTRDVNLPARVLPAADWAELEAMKIGE